MSSNVFRCRVADIREEHLSSMRFCSLRMKLTEFFGFGKNS